MNAHCPRCAGFVAPGPHASAYCSRCMFSFRADDPESSLPAEDRRQLAAVRHARPDLAITAILPPHADDGPYMRTFKLADGQTAMLRKDTNR